VIYIDIYLLSLLSYSLRGEPPSTSGRGAAVYDMRQNSNVHLRSSVMFSRWAVPAENILFYCNVRPKTKSGKVFLCSEAADFSFAAMCVKGPSCT
jgi:hypothetical protein